MPLCSLPQLSTLAWSLGTLQLDPGPEWLDELCLATTTLLEARTPSSREAASGLGSSSPVLSAGASTYPFLGTDLSVFSDHLDSLDSLSSSSSSSSSSSKKSLSSHFVPPLSSSSSSSSSSEPFSSTHLPPKNSSNSNSSSSSSSSSEPFSSNHILPKNSNSSSSSSNSSSSSSSNRSSSEPFSSTHLPPSRSGSETLFYASNPSEAQSKSDPNGSITSNTAAAGTSSRPHSCQGPDHLFGQHVSSSSAHNGLWGPVFQKGSHDDHKAPHSSSSSSSSSRESDSNFDQPPRSSSNADVTKLQANADTYRQVAHGVNNFGWPPNSSQPYSTHAPLNNSPDLNTSSSSSSSSSSDLSSSTFHEPLSSSSSSSSNKMSSSAAPIPVPHVSSIPELAIDRFVPYLLVSTVCSLN